MTQAEKGKVYLVGAGPGDPELLTLRAVFLLRSADIIYHDDLVSSQVLQLARESALVVSVGKRCGVKKVSQLEINGKLVESASRGLSVVRLKSGDPLIFGRAGEELAALAAAGIAYEVVPGISAAMAAAASIGRSLTNRNSASSVLLTTGHHADDQNLDLPPTRVVYMPGNDLAKHSEHFLSQGHSPLLPCVLVSRISQPDQSIFRTRLADLAVAPIPASPAVLLVGWALSDENTLQETARDLALPMQLTADVKSASS
jgi:uroporphyrin-III C-methyltransferase